jgi:hypothetical protein
MSLSNSAGIGFNQSGYGDGVARLLVAVSLSISIIFPGGFMPIQAGVFLLLLVIVLIGMLIGRVSLSLPLYLLSLFYALIGLAWSFYGEMLGTPGAMKVMAVMVAYPILVPLCSPLYREEDNSSLYSLFLVCAWIMVGLDLVFMLDYCGAIGNTLHTIFDSVWAGAGSNQEVDHGIVGIHLMNTVSMIFLLPFILSYLFFSKSRSGKIHIYLLVLLMITAAFLANRRALLLTAILGPVIAFLLTVNSKQSKGKLKTRRVWIVLLTIALVVWILLAMDTSIYEYYIDLILSAFDFTSDDSNLARVSQFHSLLEGISEAPLWGHGAGAVAGIVRSDGTPWAYELTYVAFVFQYGIICFLIYAFGIVFLCWQLISSIREKGRSSFEFYLLSGFIAFMLANASNPYLGSFDSMWALFIPYAVVNRRLLQRKLRIDLAPVKLSLSNPFNTKG